MRLLKALAGLTFVFTIPLIFPVPALSAPEDRADLVQKLQSAYEKYRQLMGSVKGTFSGKFLAADNNGKVSYKTSWTWKLKLLDQYGTFEEDATTETFKPDGSSRAKTEKKVFGENSKYSFSLIGKEDGWLLKEVLFEPKVVLTPGQKRVEQRIDSLISRHYHLHNLPLPSVVGSGDFKLISTADDSGNLVRVRYELKVPDKRTGGDYRGEFLLDSRYWCIVKHDANFHRIDGEKSHHIWKFEVAPMANGTAKLTRAYEKGEFYNGYREPTHEINLEYGASVDQIDLTLSAFGLPEPMGVVWPKRTRWWLWLTLFAAGAVVIAMACRRAYRRYRPAQPANQA
jgi:hypothetical protein